jgi:hypothetical protein
MSLIGHGGRPHDAVNTVGRAVALFCEPGCPASNQTSAAQRSRFIYKELRHVQFVPASSALCLWGATRSAPGPRREAKDPRVVGIGSASDPAKVRKSEGLHACEVRDDRARARVTHRLIDVLLVGITMHQNDLTRELLRLVPKLGQEVEVSGLGPARAPGFKSRVAMRHDQDGRKASVARDGKGFPQPGPVCCAALQVFRHRPLRSRLAMSTP